MSKDPVCEMDVDESLAIKYRLFVQHEEKTFYFCSDDCKDQFQRYPAVYSGVPTPWFEDNGESTSLDLPPY